jgi:hypothetical protein
MSSSAALGVAVCDFWEDHDPAEDTVINTLLPGGVSSVDMVDVASADLIVHSVFETNYLRAGGTLVTITNEPYFHDRAGSHWTIDWRFIDEATHLRLPVWVSAHLNDPIDFDGDGIDPANRRFCNFVFGNGRCAMRNSFFEALHRREPVDSLGRVYNNTQHPDMAKRDDQSWRRSKVEVLGNYKFTIAFENTENLGYTTEKLLDAWLADTVPIYWGNPALGADLPVGSCLSLYEAGSIDKLVEQVLETHRDPVLYDRIRQANPFRTGEIHEVLDRFTRDLTAFGARVHADAVAHAGTKRISPLRRVHRRLRLLRSMTHRGRSSTPWLMPHELVTRYPVVHARPSLRAMVKSRDLSATTSTRWTTRLR